jgi:hypothetical protein
MTKQNNFLNIGNITTILNSIFLILLGYIVPYLVSLGFNVPWDISVIASFLTAIVLGIFSYFNASRHNNFFDEDTDTVHIPVPLTQAQIDAIQNFINIQTGAEVEIIGDDQPENDVDVDADDREINQ